MWAGSHAAPARGGAEGCKRPAAVPVAAPAALFPPVRVLRTTCLVLRLLLGLLRRPQRGLCKLRSGPGKRRRCLTSAAAPAIVWH